MESEHNKQKGFMKSKLVMSFCKAAKPSTTVQVGTSKLKPSPPASSTVTLGSFGGSDGYVHGPGGGAGDKAVDTKASRYILQVKERLILEEMVMAKGKFEKDYK